MATDDLYSGAAVSNDIDGCIVFWCIGRMIDFLLSNFFPLTN
jgi:hypothetical protein